MTVLDVVAAACFAGGGALALVAIRGGLQARARTDVQPHTEPRPARLEVFGPYEAGEAEGAEFHYCHTEMRVTAHAVGADGVRRCWHCPPQGEA
ncbi:hypothetical protein GCM10010250_21300 [Streptomyces althioticus]|uniref:hypothetical protein n=1 Tax=Streptomyces althioticus TaxID=83380 RepID=UPI0018767127|nr:hypothetical protein GCM10010250_21300 [Streptomyces althioticus]